jgi:iron complex outermembrane receptor protein
VKTDANNPISLRTTEYSIGRDGVTSDVTWEMGDHTIAAGLWGERNNHTASRNYYGVTGPADTMYFLSKPFATDWKQNFITTTSQYYLQDTLALMDGKLKQRRLQVAGRGHQGHQPGRHRAAGSLSAEKKFLPQAGFNYARQQRR